MTEELSRSRRPSELALHEKDRYSESEERALDPPDRKDRRSPFERDRDKILYCRDLRRLKDVTQVARAGETYLHHDRLTHSLKVAQVGQRLAELLLEAYDEKSPHLKDYLDPNVVEAACLAHDLGHPPFGHNTEKLLDEKVREASAEAIEERRDTAQYESTQDDARKDDQILGYEGNAQSFRIVTRLIPNSEEYPGADLTRATLNAMLKYPWKRETDLQAEDDTDEKWGYYPGEKVYFDFARTQLTSRHRRTLEAEIMDYADDVTYAIHDVEDFYRDGLIPVDKLLREARDIVRRQEDERGVEIELAKDFDGSRALGLAEDTELAEFEDYVKRESDQSIDDGEVINFFVELVLDVPTVSDHFFDPYEGTAAEQRAINQFVSSMVARYLEAPQDTAEDRDHVYLESAGESHGLTFRVDRKFKLEIEALKRLTEFYVISRPSLVAQQRGQTRVITELFEQLLKEADPEAVQSSAIPTAYREQLEEIEDNTDPRRARVVADMIASMTEPQAVTLHKRLVGRSPGSLQDQIIR